MNTTYDDLVKAWERCSADPRVWRRINVAIAYLKAEQRNAVIMIVDRDSDGFRTMCAMMSDEDRANLRPGPMIFPSGPRTWFKNDDVEKLYRSLEDDSDRWMMEFHYGDNDLVGVLGGKTNEPHLDGVCDCPMCQLAATENN